MVRDQARRKASSLLTTVDHTMALEQQRSDAEAHEHELDRLTEELVDSRGLWSS